MKLSDIVVSPDCKPLFDEVQAHVLKLMKDYLPYVSDLCEREGLPKDGKDIFDPVWGSISITPEELCFLDSPLIQKLRRIKQLGFTSMVYCSADYSRFSHTIGVLEAASRMAEVIHYNKHLDDTSDYDFISIVRMAAIIHDSGHTFLSHVSETYFTNNQSGPLYKMIYRALLTFRKETWAKRAKLHELISVMMLYTREIQELLYVVGQPFFKTLPKSRERIRLVYDYIACLIIGQACDAAILPYSSIINGPIDADKIDYLSRDSACTKVPIAVDVARLIQKLTVVELKKGDYKHPPIWTMTGADMDKMALKAMALNYSARKSCWQLSIARSIMFESVYYHHKKLSAETMFHYAYELLESKLSDYGTYNYEFVMSVCDDFLSAEMIHCLLDNQNISLKSPLPQATVFDAIFNRNLWKRVASFSLNTLQASSGIAAPNVAYSDFLSDVMLNYRTEKQLAFFNKLRDEIARVAEFLDVPFEKDYPLFAFIESMPPTDEYNDIDSVLIEYGNGEYKRASELFKGEPWMQGKENKQNEYFLITNVRERDIVYIALEKVLYEYKEKYLLDIEAVYCSKLTKNDIDNVKMKLLFKEYYINALELVPHDIVLSIIGSNEVQNVADMFKSFQGKDGSKVDEKSLKHFLWQFFRVTTDESTIKRLFTGILSILKNSDYVNRERFKQLANDLFKKISEYTNNSGKDIISVNIGGSRDSSASWSYYFNDQPERLDTVSIEKGLRLCDENYLVFFDDGAYSGSQIISIFQEYMGIPRSQRTTNEHHVDKLTVENQEKLKKANIILAYLYFNEASEDKIIREMHNLGIENVKIVSVLSLNHKIFDRSDIFPDAETKELLSNTLAEIGESILATSKKLDGDFKERWDEERVSTSSLGYNDAQQMIVFERNIPTYSLTAFWAPNGKYKDSDWDALFHRTEKD